MRIYSIKPATIENGLGVRVSVFVSGCTHHCPGCFSKPTWDFDAGVPFDDNVLESIINYVNNDYVDGITILGGDPLHFKNIKDVEHLLKAVRERCPGKNVWLYTGYLFEDVKEYPIMRYIDVLVDGEFKQELKTYTVPFRGSSNQRLIDVPKSLQTDFTVLLPV